MIYIDVFRPRVMRKEDVVIRSDENRAGRGMRREAGQPYSVAVASFPDLTINKKA
jgi:hypothetical protein